MATRLQGLRKQLNKKMKDADLSGQLREHSKGAIQDAINDWLVSQLKSSGLEQYIAGLVGDVVKAIGFDLTLTNIRDKDATRADFDNAVTAKINQLAGTQFTSLQHVNRDEINTEVGRILGEKLGVGALFPVSNFRDELGNQLVQAFDGGNSLFSPGVVAAIENNVVAGWRELSPKAVQVGNPMAGAGAPRDAAQAAKRAAGRKRQEKYRRSHSLHWVEMGAGG